METKSKLNYILGLDIGTNSIGWAMLRLDKNSEPCAIIKMGSRIFSNGRNEKGVSLAVDRRTARGQRRNHDRRLQMYRSLLNYLISSGLLPKDDVKRNNLSILNPYEIRSKAINEKVDINHLGRALIHIAKHRGFKSNRLADKKADEEKGKISSAIARFKEILKNENCKTVGEYFYKLNKEGISVRSRLRVVEGLKAKQEYERYLERQMVVDEYKLIMSTQQKYYVNILTDKVVADIEKIIFTQRPLKPQDIGKCSIYHDELRASKALPIAQEFIYLQKLHDIRVYAEEKDHMRPLNENEFEYLKQELSTKSNITYSSISKQFIKNKFSKEYGDFNFEATDKLLKGNLVNSLMSNKLAFGNVWNGFDDEKKNEIITTLLSENLFDNDIEKYLTDNYPLSEENVTYIMNNAFKKLPDGYMQYSLKFLNQIVPLMRNYGGNFTAAKDYLKIAEVKVQKADLLPYYGYVLTGYLGSSTGNIEDAEEKRFGKIANPTVHIALNELRKLINALIQKYGKPEKIVVEVGRELKQNEKQKDKLKKEQYENRLRNDQYTKDYPDKKLSREDRLKLRLWDELGTGGGSKECVYTGVPISVAMLFSNDVQVEHILPFSKTLDDSYSNKTLSLREANYYKGDRSPYEAFHSNPGRYNYEDILARAKSCLPPNKAWRFDKDAMDRFNDDPDFADRQLTDMQYITKLTTTYLKAICDDQKILSIPGRLTALLRDKLGLSKIISDTAGKNRNDHRHHAIDALVVALTTKSLLQRVSTAAGKVESKDNAGSAFRMIENFQEPFLHFHKCASEAVDNIKVSHKPDHGKGGELHEATAYGIVKNPVDGYHLVMRKPIEDLTDKMISNVRDKKIRDDLVGIVTDIFSRYSDVDSSSMTKAESDKMNKEKEKNIATALLNYANKNNIRKLRYLVKAVPDVVIKNKKGIAYKNYDSGNNLCLEVYEMKDGKKSFEGISLFNANQKGFKPEWQERCPDAKLLMRLYKGDTLTYKEDGKKFLLKITRISPANSTFYLLRLNEAGPIDKRQKEEKCVLYVYKAFNQLFNVLDAQAVTISVLGEVRKDKAPCDKLWLCGGECVNSKNDKCLKKVKS